MVLRVRELMNDALLFKEHYRVIERDTEGNVRLIAFGVPRIELIEENTEDDTNPFYINTCSLLNGIGYNIKDDGIIAGVIYLNEGRCVFGQSSTLFEEIKEQIRETEQSKEFWDMLGDKIKEAERTATP